MQQLRNPFFIVAVVTKNLFNFVSKDNFLKIIIVVVYKYQMGSK